MLSFENHWFLEVGPIFRSIWFTTILTCIPCTLFLLNHECGGDVFSAVYNILDTLKYFRDSTMGRSMVSRAWYSCIRTNNSITGTSAKISSFRAVKASVISPVPCDLSSSAKLSRKSSLDSTQLLSCLIHSGSTAVIEDFICCFV